MIYFLSYKSSKGATKKVPFSSFLSVCLSISLLLVFLAKTNAGQNHAGEEIRRYYKIYTVLKIIFF